MDFLKDITLEENMFIWGETNSFPGHRGRPGQRGGSLPKGASADSKPSRKRIYRSPDSPKYFENTFNSTSLTLARQNHGTQVVTQLRQAIRKGEEIDAIVCVNLPDGKKTVIDGHHRLCAFMEENKVPMTLNFMDKQAAWDYIHTYTNSLSRLLETWNAWDESKHPRDKKGRFTFVVGLKSFMSDDGYNADFLKSLNDKIMKYANSSKEARRQVAGEAHDMNWYSVTGYDYINDALRSGDNPKDLGVEELDDACRISADTEIKTYRGESSWNNHWRGTKVGQAMPEGLRNAFISSSLKKDQADRFSSEKRELDPNGKSSIYETSIIFKVKPSQRFGIPGAYTPTDKVALRENEIVFPWHTNGVVTDFSESSSTIGNRTVIKQLVEITLGE